MQQDSTHRLLKRLNPEQREVVLHGDGPLLVIAGPGSGKTRAIVHRMAYLVTEREVAPRRILAVTFSKKAAGEMTTRLTRMIGDSSVRVGTFHSVAYGLLRNVEDWGSWEIDPGAYRVLLKTACDWNHMRWDEADAGVLESFVGMCKAELALPGTDAAQLIADLIHEDLRSPETDPDRMMEAYAIAEEIRRTRKILTYDDMLVELAMLFRRDPTRGRELVARWRHAIMDEAQDTSYVQWELMRGFSEHGNITVVADPNQCVARGTLVETARGPVPVEDIRAGEEVLSFRNGKNVFQRAEQVWSTGMRSAVKVTTESGKQLTMSLNHRLWATTPEIRRDGELIVYLMYRRSHGFRIGITNRGIERRENPWGGRLSSEGGDKLWVIDYADDREEALLMEVMYSLGFGIPTVVFRGAERGLNQDRIDGLFKKFGQNGRRLLAEKSLSFDYPHWTAGSNAAVDRRVVRVVSHGKKSTQVFLEWTGREMNFDGLGATVKQARRGGSLVRRCFASHREAERFAASLAERSDAWIVSSLADSGSDRNMILSTASALHVGMSVAVRSGEGWAAEKITQIESCEVECFDLSVDDAENFYGNGILTHNSIYGWRGSRPELLKAFQQECEPKLVVMSRNYRSGRVIVDAANCLIESMDEGDRGPLRIQAECDFDGEVEVRTFDDPEQEANAIVQQIQKDHASGLAWGSMAVLFRLNATAQPVEEALSLAGVPHTTVGGACFYERKELKDLLAYLRIASGRGRFDDVSRSLNTPFRYLSKRFIEKVEVLADQQEDGEDELDWVALVDQAARRESFQGSQMQWIHEWGLLVKRVAEQIEDDMPPQEILQGLVDDTKYLAYLERTEGKSSENDRGSNVVELIRGAGKYKSVAEMLRHVKEAVKEAKKEAKNDDVDRVQLLSGHASKGLEFDTVYLPQFSEYRIPHPRGMLKEERRIAYVMVSRAKQRLRVSHTRTVTFEGKPMVVKLSPFAAEAGLVDDPSERSGEFPVVIGPDEGLDVVDD
jgi:DNA helicase-2/ATP-dependent DNA helicase PcrA